MADDNWAEWRQEAAGIVVEAEGVDDVTSKAKADAPVEAAEIPEEAGRSW